MKFVCKREQLDSKLAFVSRVVSVRHAMPILSNLLLETDKKHLRISGTDLELAIATHVEAEIKQEGSFTIPAKLFQDFIHQNPDEEIDFHLTASELNCKSKQVDAKIPGLEPDEYPALPKVKAKEEIMLDGKKLAEALRKISIACATDPGRPVLTGVYCELSKEGMILAATDSFRLAEQKLPGVSVSKPTTLLIPLRTVQEFIRISGLVPESDATLTIGEQQVVIKIGDVELYSRLLSGSFPKYQAIIPSGSVASLQVENGPFMQALRLATVFFQSNIANVILEVDEKGVLHMSSFGSQRGGSKNVIKAKVNPGFKPTKAAFNARFLLDACGAADDVELLLSFNGATSPLVISNNDPEYLQLVMPIRLDA